jgi:hypothetical protein
VVQLVVFGLWIVVAFNLAIILVPYLRGTGELLSIRNFFLLGFTIYQVTSGIISLTNPNSFTSEITLGQQDAIASQFLVWIITFEIFFLAFYRWGLGSKRLASWTPIIKGKTREPILWMFAFTLLGVAALLRFSIAIPYVAVITTHVGTSIAAVAAGMGAWIWVKRPFNPAAAAVMFVVLFLAIGIGTLGVFGRRPIVAISCCLVWGTYYAKLRGLPPARVVVQAMLIGIIPIVLIAKFTAVRGQESRDSRSAVATLTRVAKGSTSRGLKDLLSGQECAAWSMHLMEVYPESYDYRTLHSLRYYFELPIPRAIYPNKPRALAEVAWKDAGIAGMPMGYTIGPGILGHAGSEGGYPVLVLYACITGLFLRYFDSIVQRSPSQPFVVLPIGASLGNLLGLPRGEVPNFAFEFTVGVAGAFVMLIVVAYVLKVTGFISSADFVEDDELLDEYHDQDETFDTHYTYYGDESDPDPNH